MNLTTHLPLVPRSKDEWSYTFTPPIRLHGVVLALKKALRQLYLTVPYLLPAAKQTETDIATEMHNLLPSFGADMFQFFF
jgi:hypothetical protein